MSNSTYSQQQKIEEECIKNIFLVTLEPNEVDGIKGIVLLQKLKTQLQILGGVSTSLSTPPQGNLQQQLQFQLQQFLNPNQTQQSLDLQTSRDMIPCEMCGKLFPLEQITDHENLCGVVPSDQLPAPIISPPTVSSPVKTILDRTFVGSVIKERLEIESTAFKGAKFLIECWMRTVELQKSPDASKASFAVSLQTEVLSQAKQLLLTDAKNNSTIQRGMGVKTAFLPLVDVCPAEFIASLIKLCNPEELGQMLTPVYFELSLEMRLSMRKNLLEKIHEDFVVSLLKRFYTLTNIPELMITFANIVARDNKMSTSSTARDIENVSIPSGLFALTPIIPTYDKNSFRFLKQIPNYPACPRNEIQMFQDNYRRLLQQPLECAHSIFKKMFLDKDPVLNMKDTALSWMANLMQLNEARANINPLDPLSFEISLVLSTDGFLLNVLQTLLMFCKPFLDIKLAKHKLINPLYCKQTYRFDFSKQPKLTELDSELHKQLDYLTTLNLNTTATNNTQVSNQFNFITEIFFCALYCIHVGLMPAINTMIKYYTMSNQIKTQIAKMKAKFGDSWPSTPDGDKIKKNFDTLMELMDSYDTVMRAPEFVDTLIALCHITVIWMNSVVTQPPEGANIPNFPNYVRGLFASFPEFFVKDISEVCLYMMRVQPEVFVKPVGLIPSLIDWAVALLNSPQLVKNPIVRSKLVSILSEVIHLKSTGNSSVAQQYGYGFSQSTNLHTSVPGLITIYADVDVVEGLDVDKEKFDKYSVRQNISVVLNELWNSPQFKAGFAKEAKSQIFSKFIITILHDAIHLLEDSLGRLMDIRQLQLAMAETVEWSKQDPLIKEERERYYEIQQNSARGFLSLANSTMDLLSKLVKEPTMVEPFIHKNVLDTFTGMLNHFYDALCGPKSKNLKVQNPEKYSFSPKGLLGQVTHITLAFVSYDVFVTSFGLHPDFSFEVCSQALYILKREGIVSAENCQLFEQFLVQVNKLTQSEASTVTAPPSNNNSESMQVEATPSSLALNIPADVEQNYVAALKDLVFDSFGMVGDNGSYEHHYSSNIEQSGLASGSKMTRLAKECQMLPTSLPLSSGSSIFVRSDDERMDVMKAIITGPIGTPYSMGCFTFDIFFPPSYPQDPPLVNLETTGSSTVRFNPNLYNCGKVCLSLLGTWHGDSQTTKWNPSTSNLHQVLVSIQGLIFVPEPYYNEPAYEAQRGTKEGDQRSFEYNENLRLANIRYAMVGQLRNPTKGFENVIQDHFRVLRPFVVQQSEQWLSEASETYKAKMAKAVDDLKKELAKL